MSTDIQISRLVLNAIDTIKSRKNRPSLDRICRYLERVHNMEKDTSIRLLEDLIDKGKVREVIFNGFISYRNAEARGKLLKMKQIQRKIIMNTNRVVNGTTNNQADTKTEYVSVEGTQDDSLSLDPDKIQFFLHSQPLDPLDTTAEENAKKKRISKEQKAICSLIKASSVRVKPTKEEIPKDEKKDDSPKQKPKKVEVIGGTRKCERFSRKPAKYDPSDYVFPSLKRKPKEPFVFEPPVKKRKKVKPLKKYSDKLSRDFESWLKKHTANRQNEQESDMTPCSICHFSGFKESGKMIVCRRCMNKGHLSCVKREGTAIGWLCPDCKMTEPTICVICDKKGSKATLVSCDLCGDIFHRLCHKPPVGPLVSGKWRCSGCPTSTIANVMDTSSVIDEQSPPPLPATPQSEKTAYVSAEVQREVEIKKDLVKAEESNNNSEAECTEEEVEEEEKEAELEPKENEEEIKEDVEEAKKDEAETTKEEEVLKEDEEDDVMEVKAENEAKEDEVMKIEDEEETKRIGEVKLEMEILEVKTLTESEALAFEEAAKEAAGMEENKEGENEIKIKEEEVRAAEDETSTPTTFSETDTVKDPLLTSEPSGSETEGTDPPSEFGLPLGPLLKTDKREEDKPAPRRRPKMKNIEELLKATPMDPSIPDATEWTSLQVSDYFSKYFKPEVAQTFKEQDIDGQSLMLMQRSDVIRGLGLKLGIALKVLYHVKKLQFRRSDLKLLWAL